MNKEPEKTLDDVITLYLSNQRQIDKSVLLDMFDGMGLLSFLISHHDIKTTRHEINELIFKKVNGSKEFYNLMIEDIEPVEKLGIIMRKDGDVYWKLKNGDFVWTDGDIPSTKTNVGFLPNNDAERIGKYVSYEFLMSVAKHMGAGLDSLIRCSYIKESPIHPNGKPLSFEEYKEKFMKKLMDREGEE